MPVFLYSFQCLLIQRIHKFLVVLLGHEFTGLDALLYILLSIGFTSFVCTVDNFSIIVLYLFIKFIPCKGKKFSGNALNGFQSIWLRTIFWYCLLKLTHLWLGGDDEKVIINTSCCHSCWYSIFKSIYIFFTSSFFFISKATNRKVIFSIPTNDSHWPAITSFYLILTGLNFVAVFDVKWYSHILFLSNLNDYFLPTIIISL